MNDEEIMRIAINEARKSVKCGDIPVGAIITKDNKIIAKAYNQKEKKNSVISHLSDNGKDALDRRQIRDCIS